MAHFASRIVNAKEVLELYMADVIAEVPERINDSDHRHTLMCDQNWLRQLVEEFVTQIDEIKSARNAFGTSINRIGLSDAARAAETEEFEQIITRASIQTFVRQANTKLNQIKRAKDKLDRLLARLDGSGSGGRRFVALPQLSLKSFDGSPGCWDEFWPLFKTMIDDDKDLDDVQKMSYLDAQLRGEAKKCILGLFLFSSGNYKLAKDLLIEKYGKSENLIRDLHNQLARLPKSDKLDDDLKLQVEVERICRQLEHYGQDLHSPQVYLNLEQKLSSKVLSRYVDLKGVKLASIPAGSQWNTTLFRHAFADAVNHLKQIKDIQTRSGQDNTDSKRKSRDRSREKSSIKEEPLSSTMNMAVQYSQNNYQGTGSNSVPLGQRQSPARPSRGERNTDRPRSPDRKRSESRDSSQSSQASSRASSNGRGRAKEKRKDSPHPAKVKVKSGSPSTSRSRSPARFPCKLCKGIHFEIDCPKFRNSEQRKNAAIDLKLCFVCLTPGHFASQCPRYKQKCPLCRTIKHHLALCPKRYTVRKEQVNTTNEVSESETSALSIVASSCIKDPTKTHSLLKCVKVTVYNPLNPKKRKKCALGFLDDGSHKSYARDTLIKELGLEMLSTVDLNVTGLGGIKLGEFKSGVFELGLKGEKLDMLIKVRSLNRVMPKLPFIQYDEKHLNKIKTNKIKIKPVMQEPDIMIGGDYYNHLGITPILELANGFWISSSKLGMIISGEGKIENFEESSQGEVSNAIQEWRNFKKEEAITGCVMDQTFEFEINGKAEKTSDANLDKLIERQNLLENIGLSDLLSNDDDKWLKDFEDKLYFNGERYEVKLSWNDEVHALPDNYGLAIGRLRSTMKKLKENPALMEQYNEIFVDQLNKGIIEKAPKKRSQVTHYLPHHFVERQDKAFTKLRIVFDASAKLRKEYPSLNECLNKGPKLYNDLTGILLRSRLKKYLMTCDVEKAFLQIGIAPEDRDALRFLWYTDPNDEKTLTEFRFCRVTFGVICSPAHLQVVLNNHFKLYEGDIVRNLESDSYVDNISIEMENAEDTRRNYEYLKKIFKEANMNVREFTSNAWQEILELPEEDRTGTEMTKLLGLHWNVRKDTLAVKFPYFDMDKPITRRSILSQIHKPYDPTGLTGQSF